MQQTTAGPGLKVWGRRDSTNVQKVLWCCAELDLEYEQIDAGGRFGRTAGDFLKLNPNGLVPVIEHDGQAIWESNTILRYLSRTFDRDRYLLPAGPQPEAQIEKWMDWQLAHLLPGIAGLFATVVKTPSRRRDSRAIAEAQARAEAALRVMDRHLATNAFLAGVRFSLADLPCGVLVQRWLDMEIERPLFSHLGRWHGELARRRHFRELVMLPLVHAADTDE